MIFQENEMVSYFWKTHLTDNSGGHYAKTKTAIVKFIKYKGAKSAILEFQTPLGKERRSRPLTSIAKLEVA